MLVDHLLKTKKEFKNLKKKTGHTKNIYKNELDKACFQPDMAYGDFKDLARRTASDKVLKDEAINIAKNPKYDGYQRGFASMVYKFFNKKSASGSGAATLENKSAATNEIKQNLQLAEKLNKPIIRNFKNRTVYSRFKTIFGVLI